MPLERLVAIMRRLRDPVSGCEWDREQTFATIAPYTIEEAYEVADAIARDDMDSLADELGDLLGDALGLVARQVVGVDEAERRVAPLLAARGAWGVRRNFSFFFSFFLLFFCCK